MLREEVVITLKEVIRMTSEIGITSKDFMIERKTITTFRSNLGYQTVLKKAMWIS